VLAACASTPREGLVYLGLAGSEQCTVHVEEQRFALPAQADALARRTKSLASRTQGAIVGAGEEPLGFACWREAMEIVRRAGFARLGLIITPPPEPKAVQPPVDPPKTRRTPA
jgi:hypothetical protein